MGMRWITISSIAFLALSLATSTASAATITLSYQPPKVGTYYEHILAQGNFYNAIDKDSQLVARSEVEEELVISTVVSSGPEGQRFVTSVDGWGTGNRDAAMRAVKLTLKDDMNDAELDSALERFMRLHPPEYLVDSSGKIVSMKISDAYRKGILVNAIDILESAENLSDENKRKYSQLFEHMLAQLKDKDFLKYVERYRSELTGLDGLELELAGTPIEGITLYKQRDGDHYTEEGTLEYAGRALCNTSAAEQNCIVLKHIEASPTNDDSLVNRSVTTLIVDASTLQVYSELKIKSDRVKPRLHGDNLKPAVVISRDIFVGEKPSTADFEKARDRIATTMGFQKREATWEDFSRLYRLSIANQSSLLKDCNPFEGLWKDKRCDRLWNLYRSEELMIMFSNFENSTVQKDLSKDRDIELLYNINDLLAARAMFLSGVEIGRTSKRSGGLSEDKILELWTDVGISTVKASPIKSDRHQRYLSKLEVFLEGLKEAVESDSDLDLPVR